MRAWLISVMIMAGCLRSQAPTLPRASTPAQKEFAHLVYDAETIERAAKYAEDHRMKRGEWYDDAKGAYIGFMGIKAYDTAAEIAWRFHFDPIYVGFALRGAHRDAKERIRRYRKSLLDGNDSKRRWGEAVQSLDTQTLIACRYSSVPEAAAMAVKDAERFRQFTWEDDVLYPLLDYGCPVEPVLLSMIIDSAVVDGRYDFALRHAAEADWSAEENVYFVGSFFRYPARCDYSFLAVAALKIKAVDIIPWVKNSNCEFNPISSDGWAMSVEDASAYFFAALQGGKYNLAFELLPFTGFDGDMPRYVFQEATRDGFGANLVKMTALRPEYLEAFMQYSFDHGEYRFIGMSARTPDWERKAFDKLLELGQWDFAAEVAQYGIDADFREEGIRRAFHAAMAAGAFKTGLYLLARYGSGNVIGSDIITRAMYDNDRRAYLVAKSRQTVTPSVKKRRKRKPSACPSDDWCVKGER